MIRNLAPTPEHAPPAQSTASPVIQIDRAHAQLGGQTIWRDVSFSVQPGEFIAILGPNGAGKSTLLKALLGLVPLASGSVTILGRPARRGNPSIGYVPQRRHFDADVRVRGRDIVRLGVDGNRWGLPLPILQRASARDAADRVQEMIERVGATTYADRPIGELSGGEQQRLLIAQALVTRPQILALDEPLDSLDLRNQQGIAAIIRDISRATGAAVLLVAHDINPILDALDRVVYVARGQVAVGAPGDVITSATLTQLYGAPIEVLRASDGRLVVIGHIEEEVCYHAARP